MDKIIERICSVDSKTFESAIVDLKSSPETCEAYGISAIDALSRTTATNERERSRRLRLALETMASSGLQYDPIIELAKSWPASSKNAVMQALPNQYKQSLYSRGTHSAESETQPASSKIPALDGESFVHLNGTVLLLGTLGSTESNLRYLSKTNFEGIRVSDPRTLDDLLSQEVCGIIVDGTWWNIVGDENHEIELDRVLCFSSFAYLKIDLTNLSDSIAQAIDERVKKHRFRTPDSSEFHSGESSRIAPNDITRLRKCCEVLDSAKRVRFHPAELEDSEELVLLAALQKHVQNRHTLNTIKVQRVSTKVLDGGLSSARIAVMNPDDGGRPLVSKIDDIGKLKDEMLRFSYFIRPIDDRLNPELHVHGKKGLILFGLVGQGGELKKPAPTLFERIGTLARRERLSKDRSNTEKLARFDDLVVCIDRLLTRVKEINTQVPSADCALPSRQWLTNEPLSDMCANEVCWVIDGVNSASDLLELSNRLCSDLSSMATSIVHGDLHSRNVLVVDDKEPFLIDYANCGPGHPLFDIVRIESHIVFSFLRMTDSELAITDCLKKIYLEEKNYADLQSTFPTIFSSTVNRLCIYAAIKARDTAKEISTSKGIDRQDFLKMKMLVTLQHLTMHPYQTAIVRGTIGALFSHLEKISSRDG